MVRNIARRNEHAWMNERLFGMNGSKDKGAVTRPFITNNDLLFS